MSERIFVAKSWALFHDPPHKAWHLTKRARFFGESHKEEAIKVWSQVIEGTRLNGLLDNVSERVVERADWLAAGLDRWLLMRKAGEKVHNYIHLINPFNPDIVHRNPDSISKEAVDRFIERLNGLLRKCISMKECYNVLYLAMELAWAAEGLPIGPADTRMPTHSIFDHLYATAAMVNWSWSEEPSGYLVYLDIPSIQRIISGARKVSDYWAGSWLVSKLMWNIVSEIVKKIGPDTLLLPTARLNPFYLRTVFEGLRGGIKEELIKILRDSGVYEYFFTENGEIPPVPVIPGTASLVLPPDFKDLMGSDPKEYFEEDVKKKWKDMIEQLRKELSGEQDCSPKAIIGKLLSRFIDKVSEPQLSLRVIVLNVGEIYEALRALFLEKEVPMGILYNEDLSKLQKSIKELKSISVGEEGLKNLLLYVLLGPRLRKFLFEDKARRLIIPPLWQIRFTEQEFEENRSWSYCTVCGEEPALIKLERKIDRRTGEVEDDYSDETIKKLEEMTRCSLKEDRNKRDLMLVLKPGEALGPLCIVKRALWLHYSKSLEKLIGTYSPSNEAISLSVVKKVIYKARDTILNVERILESLVHQDEKYKSAYAVFYGKKEIDYDLIMSTIGPKSLEGLKRNVKNFFRELSRNKRYEKLVNIMAENYSSIVSNELDMTLRLDRVKDLLGLRTYYAIVVGDADNVGKLLTGKLDLRAGEYVDKVVKMAGLRGDNEAVVRESLKVTAGLGEGLTLLPSPSYLSSLSKALMITALKDIRAVIDGMGLPVYDGGDDVAVLLPVETSLQTLKRLRLNYWGENNGGFHMLGKLVTPAPTVYGRSFSLRLSHVMDPMKFEIEEARRLLEEVAKEARWDRWEKDSAAFSRGRVKYVAVLFLRDLAVIDGLRKLWIHALNRELSTSLPEDYESFREASKYAWPDILAYVLKRNARKRRLAEELACESFFHDKEVAENMLTAFKVWRVMPE